VTGYDMVMTRAGVLAGLCVSGGGSQVQVADHRHLTLPQVSFAQPPTKHRDAPRRRFSAAAGNADPHSSRFGFERGWTLHTHARPGLLLAAAGNWNARSSRDPLCEHGRYRVMLSPP
jgi:hypothetical protein